MFSAPPYNFNPQQLGYLFVSVFVGSLFGGLYGGALVDWAVVWFTRRNGGLYEPEMRLYLLPLPALSMSAGLAVFGVTADRVISLYPSATTAQTILTKRNLGLTLDLPQYRKCRDGLWL